MRMIWHYLPAKRSRPLAELLRQPLLEQSNGDALVVAEQYQSVLYAAIALPSRAVTAWLCPLDVTGEYGRHLVGYQVVAAASTCETTPAAWFRAPTTVLAALTGETNAAEQQWRQRCESYQQARAALGSLQKGCVVNTERAVAVDDRRAFWFHCLDGKRCIFRVLDLPGQPVHIVPRETLLAHHARVVTSADRDLHRLFLAEREPV